MGWIITRARYTRPLPMKPPHLVPRAPVAALVALLTVSALVAHERKTVGSFQLIIGWGEEPAFTGIKNSLDVRVQSAAGGLVQSLQGTLMAEVSFGDQRMSLPLMPTRDRPDLFRGTIIPTRAGTYAFHITGKINDQPIDVTSTCSPTTLECVVDPGLLQFPAKDPSNGQLADGLGRTLPRVDRAMADASRAQTLSLASIALAALAVVFSVLLWRRRRV